MRLGLAVRALVLAALVPCAVAASGCKAKGNGVGTAPPTNPCPTTVVEGQACGVVADVCLAACGGATGPVDGGTASYLYCPGGTGAVWLCVGPGDGGVIENPDAPDADAATDADASPEAGDADASDASDADGGSRDTALDADESDADGAVDLDAGADADADESDAPDGD